MSGWLDKAKQTSTAALAAAKRDVSEFISVVTRDTSEAISHTSEALKEKLHLVEGDETAIASKPKTPLQSRASSTSSSMVDTMTTSRSQAELNALQVDIATYCNEPDDMEQFESWSAGFNLDLKTKDISELLVSNAQVRALQTKLVPNVVSYRLFWLRYFYKVHKWKENQDHRAKIMERASIHPDDKGELEWEDEEDEPEKEIPANTESDLHQSTNTTETESSLNQAQSSDMAETKEQSHSPTTNNDNQEAKKPPQSPKISIESVDSESHASTVHREDSEGPHDVIDEQSRDAHVSTENGSSKRTSASGTPVSTSSESFVTLPFPNLDTGEDTGGMRMAEVESNQSDDLSIDEQQSEGQTEFVMVASSLIKDAVETTETDKVEDEGLDDDWLTWD